MAIIPIVTTQFGGGIQANSKTGTPGGCRFSRNLAIYDDDDSVSLNPIPVKISGSTVTGLVLNAIDTTPFGTDKYFYDDAGNIYKYTSGGTLTLDRAISSVSAAGQGMVMFQDFFYYATNTTIGRCGPISATPAYSDDFLSNRVFNLDQSQNTSSTSNTYTTPTSISETSTALCSIVTTIDPIKEIDLHVAAVGTGNWTVTLHDANNNSLGTATVVNGSMATGYQAFTFTTPVRVINGQTYHFHVTSTVADGTVHVLTSSDFSTANYKEYSGILIGATYHPMIQHTNGLNGTVVIGNANYLAEYDPYGGTYNANKITLQPGWNVRSICRDNEFIVAFCTKGNTSTSSDEGRAFWWDGISPYYNYNKPVNGGSPNTAISFKNRIFSILGVEGDMNLSVDPFRLIQPAPQLPNTATVEVLPEAMTLWQKRLHFGFSNASESTYFEQGVYEFGNQSDKAISYTSVSSESLNFGYAISTGTTKSTSLKIGLVKGYGSELYIGWKDGNTYGIDKVSRSGSPAATGSWESQIEDRGLLRREFVSMPQKEKYAKRVMVTFAALPTGCTVTPKYKINRASSFTTGTAATAGATFAVFDIEARYREIEYGFDLTATVNYPTITGVYLEVDVLSDEDFTAYPEN